MLGVAILLSIVAPAPAVAPSPPRAGLYRIRQMEMAGGSSFARMAAFATRSNMARCRKLAKARGPIPALG